MEKCKLDFYIKKLVFLKIMYKAFVHSSDGKILVVMYWVHSSWIYYVFCII